MNKQISSHIYYVGVDDLKTQLFEGLWPLHNGVSYNSYLVLDDKITLIDTVEHSFFEEFFENVNLLLNGRKIDFLVINHMEPDHSSSIALLREKFPEMTIVGNSKTIQMINGFYGIDSNTKEITDGEELCLGNTHLKFYFTPMVHWPETMMTYCLESGILFSGDAFGTFGALNGSVVDNEDTFSTFKDEMVRYYSNIVGKYGSPVQKALSKLKDLKLDLICSTHGPVWQKNIDKVVSTYDKLSRFESERGTVIAYSSMYGNTEKAAISLAAELKNRGEENIKVHHLNTCNISDVLRDIYKYDTLIIASPTYNGGIFPATEALMRALQSREVKNRRFGSLGSFCWAGASVKKLTETATQMGWTILEGSTEFKQGYSEQKCDLSTLITAIINR